MAVITRYYENAKYMTDMRWALLLGATVIKKDTWDRSRPTCGRSCSKRPSEAGAKLQAEIRKSGDADVAAMKGRPA